MYSKIIFLAFTVCVVNASVITLNGDDDELQKLDDFEESPTLRSCNYQECDQRCRRLKFPGGACVNGRCKCDNFRTSEDFGALIEEYSARRCNPQECDQRCRRLKFPGGVCVNGRCKCDNFRNVEDFGALIEEYSERKCDPQECNQRCRRLKFPGGVCVNGRCKCDNFRNVEDNVMPAVDPTDMYTAHKCVPRICERVCHSLRFESGTCVNGRCKCVKKESSTTERPLTRDSEAMDSEDSMSVNEDFAAMIEEYSSRKCNPQECNQRCRRLKFPGGVCVNGRCKCDNFRNVEDNVVLAADPTDVYSAHKCVPRICERVCHSLRFESGTCVNGRCKCVKKESSTTERPLTRDSEAMDSEDSMSVNEDFAAMIEEYSSRKCNPQECNQRCRRLKFPGGVCVNGRCKCDNFRKAEEAVVEKAEQSLDSSNFFTIQKCYPRICNQFCRFLRFDSGSCVNDRCQCARNEPATTTTTTTSTTTTERAVPKDSQNEDTEDANIN